MSAEEKPKPAPVTTRQAYTPVEGPVEVTAGWVQSSHGPAMVLLGLFDDVASAENWIRSKPAELRHTNRAEIRHDGDYLTPVLVLERHPVSGKWKRVARE